MRRDVAECFASPDVILEEVVECYVKVHLRSSDERQRVCVTDVQHHRFVTHEGSIKLFHHLCFDLSLIVVHLPFSLKKKKNHSKGHKKMRSDKEEQARSSSERQAWKYGSLLHT